MTDAEAMVALRGHIDMFTSGKRIRMGRLERAVCFPCALSFGITLVEKSRGREYAPPNPGAMCSTHTECKAHARRLWHNANNGSDGEDCENRDTAA